MSPTDWLPPLICLEEFGGDWEVYENAVYDCFYADFVASQPTFEGSVVRLQWNPLRNGREYTYWHLISGGDAPDLRRCERIRWPRAMLDCANPDLVRCWRNKRGSETGVVLSTADFSYVLVLRERTGYVLLWTAYHVEYSNRRRQLEREWQRAQEQRN